MAEQALGTAVLEHVSASRVGSLGSMLFRGANVPPIIRAAVGPAKAAPQTIRSRRAARQGKPALLELLVLLLAAFALGGCQHVIEPPASVSDPVRVFVIDYGRHASLALPQEKSGLVEWSWGDWNWFALERTGPLEGLQALFASPRSTLSRRELAPAGNAEDLAVRLRAQEVLSLDVERERARALLRHLEARWLRRRDQAVTHPSGRVFVPDDARYSLSNNSVHELARWIEALGADVSGTGVTANFKLRQPRSAPKSPR